MATVQLLIDGKWCEGSGGEARPIMNPATEEVGGEFAVADVRDLTRAAEVAKKSFDIWKRVPALERSGILRQAGALLRARASSIAEGITRENGKTLVESVSEVNWAADYLEWYAEECRRAYGRVIPAKVRDVRQFVVREPVGPVLALSPWNWPLVTAVRKVAPALAAGCSVILKPAEECPSGAVGLATALIDAGLPAGVLNLVYGVPATISQTLIAAPEILKISFTGSIPVGRQLAELAAKGLKRITLELGGHAPVIVCEDADLPAAVRKILPIKFRTSGEVCSCPTRFYVHRSVKAKFVELMAEACSKLKVGNGMEKGVDMGPLISARRLAAMTRLVDDAVAKGAHIVTGGTRVGDRGFFFAPTVLDDVTDEATIMSEEPFGPLVPVIGFDSYEEVVKKANSVNVGLASYVFTQSLVHAQRLGEEIEAGMVGINTLAVSMAEAPFGGVKESGNGQEGGIEGMEPYMVTKFIAQAIS